MGTSGKSSKAEVIALKETDKLGPTNIMPVIELGKLEEAALKVETFPI